MQHAWCNLTSIEGHMHVVRRQGLVNHMALAKFVLRGLNDGEQERWTRGVRGDGGRRQGARVRQGEQCR